MLRIGVSIPITRTDIIAEVNGIAARNRVARSKVFGAYVREAKNALLDHLTSNTLRDIRDMSEISPSIETYRTTISLRESQVSMIVGIFDPDQLFAPAHSVGRAIGALIQSRDA